MDAAATLASIAGVLLLGVMIPGSNFALVTAHALTASRRAGVMSALGLALATATWAFLAMAGLGLVIHRVSWLAWLVRFGGGAYLIWIGITMLRVTSGEPRAAVTGGSAFRQAYFSSMTNPKALAFYGSIFAAMVPAGGAVAFYAAIVVIAGAVSLAWYGGVALLLSAGPIRDRFLRARPVISVLVGLVLAVLGLRLVLGY